MTSTLYIESEATTAVELSAMSAGGPGLMWFIPATDNPAQEVNLCREGLTYKTLAEAPRPEALAIARRLEDTLEGVMLPASESDTKGRVFIITPEDGSSNISSSNNANQMIRDACLDALGIVEEARSCATFQQRDWTEAQQTYGFCYTEDDFEEEDLEEDDAQSDRSKIMRATQIMADELQNGFEFNFNCSVVCGPVLHGGFVGQDIVGILSMRVWT